MDVVLLERVEKLGHMGDVVKVKDGYARNYLLPQGKALRATKANMARFEAQKAELEARNADARAAAETLAASIDGKQFVVIRAASEAGALYGSVAPRDIADLARAEGFEIDRRQVVLDRPIKDLGLHAVRLQLHPEVAVSVSANVARSEEEAAMQASGKSIQELRAEEEAEAEFEISELFDDLGGAADDEDDDRRGESGPVDVPEGDGGDDQPQV
ncbi:50S ribosomal protein L9 [Paralimibaculum aggregatum]|uniref:Large ribosomal subunit protein bL9 n=1 Tax=Paralimibaculum aggregatum TaxID=3036245 RepID=A0ABQ6LE32_9RHOB|nr:50S ribosomal protein L9 [Limibaculum sp. NKW23]GMG81207.1 50S ribosomal protein L9 [Limibaculum sp. NKW23]